MVLQKRSKQRREETEIGLHVKIHGTGNLKLSIQQKQNLGDHRN